MGSDGRGKAQWLGVQEGKSAIFVGGGGGGIAFIFRPGGLNRTIRRSQLRKTRQSNVGRRAWAETAGGWRGGFGFTGDVCQIFSRGGLGTAILRPGGRKQLSRLVPDNNDTKIKQWTKRLGLKWPGGFVWAAVRTSPFYHVVAMVK